MPLGRGPTGLHSILACFPGILPPGCVGFLVLSALPPQHPALIGRHLQRSEVYGRCD